jgi:septation ring formation regulator EzrA
MQRQTTLDGSPYNPTQTFYPINQKVVNSYNNQLKEISSNITKLQTTVTLIIVSQTTANAERSKSLKKEREHIARKLQKLRDSENDIIQSAYDLYGVHLNRGGLP